MNNYNFVDNNNKSHNFHEDGGLIYRGDRNATIRGKSFCLIFKTPSLTFCRVLKDLGKSIKSIVSGTPGTRSFTASFHLNNALGKMKLGLELTKAAFYGVFKPLEGRSLYGKIERDYYDHTSSVEGVSNKTDGKVMRLGKRLKEGSYIAPCYQPITSDTSTDKNERLIRYVSPFDRDSENKGSGLYLLYLCAISGLCILSCFSPKQTN